jgi:hypothetical protein
LQKKSLDSVTRNNLRIWGSGVRISSGAPVSIVVAVVLFDLHFERFGMARVDANHRQAQPLKISLGPVSRPMRAASGRLWTHITGNWIASAVARKAHQGLQDVFNTYQQWPDQGPVDKANELRFRKMQSLRVFFAVPAMIAIQWDNDAAQPLCRCLDWAIGCGSPCRSDTPLRVAMNDMLPTGCGRSISDPASIKNGRSG